MGVDHGPTDRGLHLAPRSGVETLPERPLPGSQNGEAAAQSKTTGSSAFLSKAKAVRDRTGIGVSKTGRK